jgi:hypothetical protein
MGWIVPRLMDFDESTINKSDATLELWKCIAKTRHSSIMGHQISSTMVELMQDAIKMPSSFIAIFLHFYKNASYLVTFLCLMYNMKFNKHYFGVNLDGRP